MTAFTRIVIVLALLRQAIGAQGVPPNPVLIGLALFLTFFIMAPVFEQAKREGLDPYLSQSISEDQAYDRITGPFRQFMLKNVREKDLALFQSIASERNVIPGGGEANDLRILVPAFMISELRRGFEIGFLIALPFLVIDLIVAMLTMSMGMMMLPPTVISLPFKVLFFVLIDGWNLLVGSLVNSFIVP